MVDPDRGGYHTLVQKEHLGLLMKFLPDGNAASSKSRLILNKHYTSYI